jgi:hypothetical protein
MHLFGLNTEYAATYRYNDTFYICGSVHHLTIYIVILLLLLLFFSRHYNPKGFRPAQLSLSILVRKVLQNAVASGTSNPLLRGEPGIYSVPTFATRGPQRMKRR